MNEKVHVNELIIADIRKFATALEKYAEEDAQKAGCWIDDNEELASRYFGSSDAYKFAARWLHHYLGD